LTDSDKHSTMATDYTTTLRSVDICLWFVCQLLWVWSYYVLYR